VSRNARLTIWLGFVFLLIGLSYAGRASGGRPARDVLYQYSTAVGGAIQYVFLLVIVVLLAGRRRELLGLRRPGSWGRALRLAVAVFFGILIFNQIVEPFLHPGREQGLTPSGWDGSRAAPYAANFLVIAFLGPIVEELTYRGLGYSLLEPYGKWVAIVVTGLLFGLSHGLIDALPVLTAFGIGLAWIRSRTGSVYPGIVVHSVFNALALIVAVAV
jgi:membrane protease YdiL (CAAX protease family)